MKDWEQPIKKTMLLHNKYEVFYGDNFPKKTRNAGFKCTKPRPPWLSVKWVEMNFEESFLSSGYCFIYFFIFEEIKYVPKILNWQTQVKTIRHGNIQNNLHRNLFHPTLMQMTIFHITNRIFHGFPKRKCLYVNDITSCKMSIVGKSYCLP